MASGPTPKLTATEAQAAVERYGGKKPAARALGVHIATFKAWLDPEANRANFRRYYAKNKEAVNERQRERYHKLTGLEYNRFLLRVRRNKALARRKQREEATIGSL